jgi:hypothetical protein
MIDCQIARDLLVLEPDSENEDLQEHLRNCSDCVTYQRPLLSFDKTLRAELTWEAPVDLSARLLNLAMMGPAALVTPEPEPEPALPMPVKPKRWYIVTVYTLTAAAIAVSLMVVWQVISALAIQWGFGASFEQWFATIAMGFEQFKQSLPVSPQTVDFALQVREQLLWLLLVAILWAIVDKWNPQFSARRQVS